MANVDVKSINSDGTATLEDGRTMQIVMAPNGAIGMRPYTDEDRVGTLDQVGPISPPKVTGLDQIP